MQSLLDDSRGSHESLCLVRGLLSSLDGQSWTGMSTRLRRSTVQHQSCLLASCSQSEVSKVLCLWKWKELWVFIFCVVALDAVFSLTYGIRTKEGGPFLLVRPGSCTNLVFPSQWDVLDDGSGSLPVHHQISSLPTRDSDWRHWSCTYFWSNLRVTITWATPRGRVRLLGLYSVRKL